MNDAPFLEGRSTGSRVKNAGPSGLSSSSASSQHLNPRPGSVGDGSIILSPRDESVKLSMSQKVTRLTNQQRADMRRLGIPLTEIDEAGYAYAPHTLTKEAAAETKKKGLFHSRNPKLPTTKTPHSLHRDYKWITDPGTGQEFIGSVLNDAPFLEGRSTSHGESNQKGLRGGALFLSFFGVRPDGRQGMPRHRPGF